MYFYEITGKEMYKVFNNENVAEKYSKNEFPSYTNCGKIIQDSESYYQFIGKDNNENYILFDYICADMLIRELISSVGIHDIFKDQKILPFDKSKLKVNKWDTVQLPMPTLFLVKETYITTQYPEGVEYDSKIEINYFDDLIQYNE